jgi:hypothetical protein
MKEIELQIDPAKIKFVVLDFGFTLSSDLYFKIAPPEYPHWRDVIQKNIFDEPHIVEQWMVGMPTSIRQTDYSCSGSIPSNGIVLHEYSAIFRQAYTFEEEVD